MSVKSISAAAIMMTTGFTAQAVEVNFNVLASIPDSAFYVTGTGWQAQTQKMLWDEAFNTLKPISNPLRMKSTKGPIKAYLQEAAVLASDSQISIPLTVTIGGVALKAGPAGAVEILNQTQAASEQIRTVTVSQTTALTAADRANAAGDYMGTVTMMFDSVPASAGT